MAWMDSYRTKVMSARKALPLHTAERRGRDPAEP